MTELVPLSATDRIMVIHGRHSPTLHRFPVRLTNGERQTAEDFYQPVGGLPAGATAPDQAATEMGLPVGTVKSRTHFALGPCGSG